MLAALTGFLAPYREALVIAALANPRPSKELPCNSLAIASSATERPPASR